MMYWKVIDIQVAVLVSNQPWIEASDSAYIALGFNFGKCLQLPERYVIKITKFVHFLSGSLLCKWIPFARKIHNACDKISKHDPFWGWISDNKIILVEERKADAKKRCSPQYSIGDC